MIYWITDQRVGPDDKDMVPVYWNDYFSESANGSISLPWVLEQDFDKCRSELLLKLREFLDEFSYLEPDHEVSHLTDLWLSKTLIHEKCNWLKSPWLVDVLKAIALQRYITGSVEIDGEITKFLIDMRSQRLSDAIVKFLSNHPKLRRFEVRKSANHAFRSVLYEISDFVGSFFRGFVGIAWLFWFFFRFGDFSLAKKMDIRNASYIFFSYALEADAKGADPSQVISRYFGGLVNVLRDEHLCADFIVLPQSRPRWSISADWADIWCDKVNTEGQLGPQCSGYTLSSFFSLSVFAAALRISLVRLFRVGFGLKVNTILRRSPIGRFASKDLLDSLVGRQFQETNIYGLLVGNVVLTYPKVKKIMYSWENLHWEYSLEAAGRHLCPAAELFAIPTSSVRLWDARYWPDKLNGGAETSVTRVVSSAQDYRNLLRLGYPQSALCLGPPMRDQNPGSCEEKGLDSSGNDWRGIVLIGEYSFEETRRLARLVAQGAFEVLATPVRLTLRPHPSWAHRNLAQAFPEFEVSKQSTLHGDLTSHTLVCVGPTTTVGRRAHELNCHLVSIRGMDGMTMSPLWGEPRTTFISNPSELTNVILQIIKVSGRSEVGAAKRAAVAQIPAAGQSWLRLLQADHRKSLRRKT